jgi:hypothetical protein
MTPARAPLAAALVAVVCLGSPAWAQTRATTADLALSVVDASGAPLPGATVTVTNADTGISRSGVTSADGRRVLPALSLGSYRVRIELNGFRPEARDVTVRLGTLSALDVTLQLLSVQQRVDVLEPAPLVDVNRTVVATVIGERQIDQLPIDRRDYISFATLAPGVSTDRTPNQGTTQSSGLAFSGQSARANNITVDGLDNNDDAVGGVRALFSQDAVREFQVLVSSYSAEFGRASGGVINIVTRSGTNERHGGLFGFFRDRSLNSRGRFDDFDAAGRQVDLPKAPFEQQQFGFTFGGPIRRNRTFAFGSIERLSTEDSAAVTIDDKTPISHPVLAVVLGTPADILRKAGFPVETGAVPFSVRSTTALAKVDHAFSGSKSLSVRFNVADGFNGNSQPFGGTVARSRGGLMDNRDYMVAGALNTVHQNRIVNEFRALVAHRDQVIQALDPACGGPCAGEDQGGPAVEVSGVASVGRYPLAPQPRLNVHYQFVDTIGLDIGRHHVKSGIDVNVFANRRSSLPLQFGGQFVFVNIPATLARTLGFPTAVSSIQAVALGLPAAYVRGYGDSMVRQTFKDVSLFAQDDWQARPDLTIRLGLRYQRQIWPGAARTVLGYPGDYRVPAGNHIAPRLGVAWDPKRNGRLSLHGSYGLFFANQFNAPVGSSAIVDGRDLRVVLVPTAVAIAAWKLPDRRLSTAALGQYPSQTLAIDPNYAAPYTHQVSVGVNSEMGRNVSVAVSGVFVKGNRYVGLIDYNPIEPSLGPNRRALDVNGVAGTSSGVNQYTSWGESWYRGLLVSVTRRFSQSSQVLASYTLSKAEDSISDFFGNPSQSQGHGRNPADLTGLPLGFDPSLERGPSLQDQRHRLSVSGTYDLPHQFHLAGILTAGSGRPYNIITGIDLNGDGDANTSPGPDRPRTNPADASTSIGRNAGRLPAEARLDLRLSRSLRLTNSARVTLMLDVLNALNRTNYTDINRVFGSGSYPSNPLPTFGQFTQAEAPRQVQVGARFSF